MHSENACEQGTPKRPTWQEVTVTLPTILLQELTDAHRMGDKSTRSATPSKDHETDSVSLCQQWGRREKIVL